MPRCSEMKLIQLTSKSLAFLVAEGDHDATKWVMLHRTHTHRVVADQLLLIFRSYPHLVVDYHHDILEFLGNLRNLSSGGEHCYLHLVRKLQLHL